VSKLLAQRLALLRLLGEHRRQPARPLGRGGAHAGLGIVGELSQERSPRRVRQLAHGPGDRLAYARIRVAGQ
jgi:hypothetical protein